jgi:hypothetical protein
VVFGEAGVGEAGPDRVVEVELVAVPVGDDGVVGDGGVVPGGDVAGGRQWRAGQPDGERDLSALAMFAEELKLAGASPSQGVAEVDWISAPLDVAQQLDLDERSPVIVRRRVYGFRYETDMR